MLGVENPLDVHPRSLPGVARAELSAQLAALAQAQGSPLLGLVLLTRHITDKGAAGTPYFYSAWVALLGMSRELGVNVEALSPRGLRREVAAELLFAVAQRSDEAIRMAALKTYEKCFARRLAAPQAIRESSNTPWRGRSL
jgi:hypothetical protein